MYELGKPKALLVSCLDLSLLFWISGIACKQKSSLNRGHHRASQDSVKIHYLCSDAMLSPDSGIIFERFISQGIYLTISSDTKGDN